MYSVSEENYIKALYHLQNGDQLVSTNDIANSMETKASSVTDMLKKLADKSLIDYIPYKGCKLTKSGQHCATQIIRKHRLWELFLVEKLNFNWDEVHEVAEQLEHIQSRKLVDEIDKLLDYPKHDPHGDPIPDSNGNYLAVKQLPLSQLVKPAVVCVSRVSDCSNAFLNYLDKHNIAIGTTLNIIDYEEYDNSYTLKINDNPLHISQAVASKIFVTITP